MLSLASTAFLFALLFPVLYIVVPWIKNIAIARRTGIPYVIVPFCGGTMNGIIIARLFMPRLNRMLPTPALSSWRTVSTTQWPWKFKYQPFAALKSDTFVTAGPGGLVLNTADADVASQIFARTHDFPKPIHTYGGINIYGDNVVGTEGAQWRKQRRLVGPVFGEGNNRLVWKETLAIARETLRGWRKKSIEGGVKSVAQDCMHLSLGVIGRAGLGMKMEFAANEGPNGETSEKELPPGHTMTFGQALTTLLARLGPLFILPDYLLERLPIKAVKDSLESYHEWGQYMRESIASKRAAITDLDIEKSGNSHTASGDLLTQLVLAQARSRAEGAPNGEASLSDSEVLGNLFVMTIAGHETSANSIHFSLVLLASHPSIQREIQKELEEILPGPDPATWDYERDLPKLFKSKLFLVMTEQLRLFPPTNTVPKCTSLTNPVRLRVNGKDCTLPPKTMVRVCGHGLHRNPKYWPRMDKASIPGDESFEESAIRLDSFAPFSHFAFEDGSMHYPTRAAYVPFSEGPRSCLGKRFAQVEVLAALAFYLLNSSVELDVSDFASDEEVVAMDQGGRQRVFEQACDNVGVVFREKMRTLITLQMQRGVYVPLRVVERGQERLAQCEGKRGWMSGISKKDDIFAM